MGRARHFGNSVGKIKSDSHREFLNIVTYTFLYYCRVLFRRKIRVVFQGDHQVLYRFLPTSQSIVIFIYLFLQLHLYCISRAGFLLRNGGINDVIRYVIGRSVVACTHDVRGDGKITKLPALKTSTRISMAFRTAPATDNIILL